MFYACETIMMLDHCLAAGLQRLGGGQHLLHGLQRFLERLESGRRPGAVDPKAFTAPGAHDVKPI